MELSNQKIDYLKKIDSTQLEILRRIEKNNIQDREIVVAEIQTNGIDPDQAKSVNVKKPGSLSSDFQVLTKVIIQYC